MAIASMGHAVKVCMDAASPIDTSSEPLEIVSCTLKATGSTIVSEGTRGTRSQSVERTAPGPYEVAGQIVCNPSPVEMDRLLPRILGADESTDTFALAETLPDFLVCVDKVAKVFTYSGCKVSRATFSGGRGQPIRLALDIIGKTEAEGNAGTYPSLTIDTGAFYVFNQGVLTIGGTAYEFDDFQLIIDNAVQARFGNSATATSVAPGDRIITLSVSTPYTSDEVALFTGRLAANASAAATLVFTNGNTSITFTLPAIKWSDPASPEVASKTSEILLPVNYRAFKTGSSAELTITNDSST